MFNKYLLRLLFLLAGAGTIGFPGGSVVQNSPAKKEIKVWSLGQEDPMRRIWQPTLVFLHEKSHRQRSLAGYSQWGRTESDTTEWLRSRTNYWGARAFRANQEGAQGRMTPGVQTDFFPDFVELSKVIIGRENSSGIFFFFFFVVAWIYSQLVYTICQNTNWDYYWYWVSQKIHSDFSIQR